MPKGVLPVSPWCDFVMENNTLPNVDAAKVE